MTLRWGAQPSRRPWLRAGLLLLGATGGCRQTPSSSTSATLAPALSPAANGRAAEASSSLSPDGAAADRDACWGSDVSPDRGVRLDQVHRGCASGMTPLFPVPRRLVGPLETPITVEGIAAGTCLRAVALGTSPVDVTLQGTRGEMLGSAAPGITAVAPPRGPACVGTAGAITLRVSRSIPAASGDEIWVQIWKSDP